MQIIPSEESSGRQLAGLMRRRWTPKQAKAGRPTEIELERRKEKVLEVAADLFLNLGYESTYIKDIAKNSGVNQETIHRHFGDKERLFSIIILAQCDAILDQNPYTPCFGTVFTVLEDFALHCLALISTAEWRSLARLMAGDLRAFPKLARKAESVAWPNLYRQATMLFEQFVVEDHAQDLSSRAFVDFIVGSKAAEYLICGVSDEFRLDDLRERIFLFVRCHPDISKSITAKLNNQYGA